MTEVAPVARRSDVEVAVVGAGPNALAVVAHLVASKPSLRERIAVLDPSGEWLRTWRTHFARLEIDVLRSPIVHHPDVDPGALARYVTEERLTRSGLPYDPPLTTNFESFCSGVIDRLGLHDLPSAARVCGIGRGDPITLTTDRGEIRTRHVVWTGNTARPVVPDAFDGVVADDGVVDHGHRVDLRTIPALAGAHVVVVGGGLTAGHLAVAAAARDATVTLVTRRDIVERDFDVEPGWLGPRHLADFSDLEDPQDRLDAALAGRGGGSMPGWMRARLRSEIDAGRLTHVVAPIDRAVRRGDRIDLELDGRTVTADRCWLATGTRPDVRLDPALAAVVDHHLDGIPVTDHDLRVGGIGLFVSGRLAMLELGPAAGNLWGARTAARRIGRALTGIDLDADAAAAIVPPIPAPRPNHLTTRNGVQP
ncbi:MAG: FAD-dependent oxidoreductase [Actinomycetota bacterium]